MEHLHRHCRMMWVSEKGRRPILWPRREKTESLVAAALFFRFVQRESI